MDEKEAQIDGARLLAIIKQEQPMVYELALRRAVIEQQNEIIAAMREGITVPVESGA